MGAERNGAPAALITGASAGIGRATALELARQGLHVLLACRDPARGRAVVDEIAALPRSAGATLLVAELSSLGDVCRLAERVREEGRALRVLINNAATWSKPRLTTAEGFERTLAVNYLAPFVLTHQLLPLLRRHAPSRVVNVTSNVVRQFARLQLDDLHAERSYSQLGAYRQSKLALVLFTRELADREAPIDLTVNCLHPGDVLTNMTARGPLIDLIRPFLPRVEAEAAARACTRLALSPELSEISGAYFEKGRVVSLGKRAVDPATSRALWSTTLTLVRPYLPDDAHLPPQVFS
ncbi:MAG: SDR family NAD(P)-dependent oxidoreductase [Polyangiales bacterium]